MKNILPILFLLVLGAFVMCVFFLPHEENRLLSQKLATQLVMPMGVVWVGLMLVCVWGFRRGGPWLEKFCVGLLILYTVTTNEYIARVLMWSLEREFIGIQPFEQKPFDAIVLLGGCTNTAVNGIGQLTATGDRLALTSRLYHYGLTERIYCTGETIKAVHPDRSDPSEEAAALLKDMGVPEDRITKLKGYNTQLEMRAVAETVPSGDRIGVVTSAWHLRRALRLARLEGLQLEPLPSDFSTLSDFRFTPDARQDIIPTSKAAHQVELCVKEYLAYLVGR